MLYFVQIQGPKCDHRLILLLCFYSSQNKRLSRGLTLHAYRMADPPAPIANTVEPKISIGLTKDHHHYRPKPAERVRVVSGRVFRQSKARGKLITFTTSLSEPHCGSVSKLHAAKFRSRSDMSEPGANCGLLRFPGLSSTTSENPSDEEPTHTNRQSTAWDCIAVTIHRIEAPQKLQHTTGHNLHASSGFLKLRLMACRLGGRSRVTQRRASQFPSIHNTPKVASW